MSRSLPETQYAESGEICIAYQTMGDGPIDFIVVPGIISHVEFFHNLPGYTDFLRALAAMGRVITFDKRGQGLSERITGAPSMEERMDDIVTVMEAVQSERAAFVTISEGGALTLLFAATYPERVWNLFICGGYSKGHGSEDYPFLPSKQEREAKVELWRSNWGKGIALDFIAPSIAPLPGARETFGRAERLSCTPSGMKHFFKLNIDADVRPTLPLVSAPTIVFHARGDRQIPYAAGQHLADMLPNARLVTLAGNDHLVWAGDFRACIDEIEIACAGKAKKYRVSHRALATVLFTDIVDSTAHLARQGDEQWRDILSRHNDRASQLVSHFHGTLIKSTGDGLLATFDGPGRGIQCAAALVDEIKSLGITIRAALHTGEVEYIDDDVSGLAVHVAARILSHAGGDEIVVSRLVTDLVAGSSLFQFQEMGRHSLKGIPGDIELFKANAATSE